MAGRTKYREPIGTFEGRERDAIDHAMRTIVMMALDELPSEVKATIVPKRPAVGWQGYDDARRRIAEHLVVRIRRSFECAGLGDAAGRGHG